MKRTCVSIFSTIGLKHKSQPCSQVYSQKNCKLHKFATTNTIFENITLLDMNHRRTYMHINFQQNWVSRSVKTVHTNLFAQYRKLHKFATTNSNFEESQSFWTCIIIKHTCISIFSKIGLKHKS